MMFRVCYRFCVFPHRLNLQYLNKLQNVLGQSFKVNEDIDQTGNVRLIDSNNKLVGVLPIDEAKRKAVASSLDLVLLNAEATPPVCRLINYSQELGSRFMKETLVADQDKRDKQIARQTKLLKLGSKISMQDLRVKSQAAKELLRKGKQVRVQIICEVDEIPQSQNVLMSFRDISIGFMTPLDEIQVREMEAKEEDNSARKDGQLPKQLVSWTFRSVEASLEKTQSYSLQDVQGLIDTQYRKLNARKFDIPVEEIEAARLKPDDDDNLQLQLEAQISKKHVVKEKKQKKGWQYDLDIGKLLQLSEGDLKQEVEYLERMEERYGMQTAVKYGREVKLDALDTKERIARIVRELQRNKQP